MTKCLTTMLSRLISTAPSSEWLWVDTTAWRLSYCLPLTHKALEEFFVTMLPSILPASKAVSPRMTSLPSISSKISISLWSKSTCKMRYWSSHAIIVTVRQSMVGSQFMIEKMVLWSKNSRVTVNLNLNCSLSSSLMTFLGLSISGTACLRLGAWNTWSSGSFS